MRDAYATEVFARERMRKLHAEAANDRLARLAVRPGRSLRSSVAAGLRALAARLDHQPGVPEEQRLATAR